MYAIRSYYVALVASSTAVAVASQPPRRAATLWFPDARGSDPADARSELRYVAVKKDAAEQAAELVEELLLGPMDAMARPIAVPQVRVRITSYNVCYTKLLRTWLWGETIRYAQALRLNYDGAPPAEDTTPDADYGRFWLKNLAPALRGDAATLPGARMLSYLFRSMKGPAQALGDFKAARAWVEACAYRFKADATRLADLWDPLS